MSSNTTSPSASTTSLAQSTTPLKKDYAASLSSLQSSYGFGSAPIIPNSSTTSRKSSPRVFDLSSHFPSAISPHASHRQQSTTSSEKDYRAAFTPLTRSSHHGLFTNASSKSTSEASFALPPSRLAKSSSSNSPSQRARNAAKHQVIYGFSGASLSGM